MTSGASDPREPCVGDPAPCPPGPLPVDELTRKWGGGRPVVSIRCTTYQHADFIGDALAGFLGQRTEFPFEVVVTDDASTDGTADVVADHVDRYPGVVRAELRTENLRQQRRPGRVPPAGPGLHGEFIAICEGDDYWTDPLKLARQVAHLRARPDCIASHHDSVMVADGVVIASSQLRDRSRDLSARELRLGPTLPLRTLLHRNDARLRASEVERFRSYIWNGDRFLTNRLGLLGGSVFAADVDPAVYRKHPGGVSSLLRTDPLDRAVTKSMSALASASYFLDAGDGEAAAAHLRRAVRHTAFTDPERGFDPRLAIAGDLIRLAAPDVARRAVRRLLPRRRH